MTTHAHLQRQLALALLLQHAKRPHSFEEIQAYLLSQSSLCDVMSSYTKRTFQRDLLVIAEDFAVNASYDQKQRGYVVTSTDPLPPGHQRLLEALELQVFLRLPAALAPHVQLEARRPLGLEHLRPLLAAVQARQVVEFTYCKFWEDQPSRRRVGPLLLKEFRGRWYLLAVNPGNQTLRCFGLDRITDLARRPDPFAPPVDFSAATYYQSAFGIIRPDDQKPLDVELAFSPTQGRYVQAFPLHASQRLLSHTDEETRIGLRVFDTHDLRMELLSMGDEVDVVAPAALRQWVRAQRTAAGSG